MALTQAALIRKGCPRCSGPMHRSYQDEYCCLLCGEYVFTETPRKRIVRDTLQAARARLVAEGLGAATGDTG